MTVTADDLKNLIYAVTGLIAAIGVAWPAIRGARGVKRMEGKFNTLHDSVADVVTKTDTIVHATNSAATASAAQTASLQKQNDMLRDALAERKETAALLTQALATAKSPPPAESTPKGGA